MHTPASGPHRPRIQRLPLAMALLLVSLGARPPPPEPTTGRGLPADIGRVAERGRDPLGLVRTFARPRVWLVLDTSTSMREPLGSGSRLDGARAVIRRLVNSLESDSGEPLVHWRLAGFQNFVQSEQGVSRETTCSDPTMGAGLPVGSPPGPPQSRVVRCGGLRVLSETGGCDLEGARGALLRRIPRDTNATRTPNGITLYQLASHIAATSLDDLAPGQQNIIVLITDGLDTCECVFDPWLDFNEGPRGKAGADELWLHSDPDDAAPVAYRSPSRNAIVAHNAGLKAKAAFLALNRGDPDAGLGAIRVVGVAMSDPEIRGYIHHFARMASDLEHPAIHADRPDTLHDALGRVLDEVTLPPGEAKVAAPRLATIKELVAGSPESGGPGAFPGSDPTLAAAALVADPHDPRELEKVLRLRSAYADNVVITTGAELRTLRGQLRAFPAEATGVVGGGAPIWDAGQRLADRDPDDRVVLFNRPGSTRLRPFVVGQVTAADLGVSAGYLREFDGRGARTASDAAEAVVRLVRGEELHLHPDTGTIYDSGGALNFGGGRGTWKLREGLASPLVVTSPPRHPDSVTRNRDAYRRFFARRVNRRTMVYLPTSGGVLHGFTGDSGEEVFAYIPDDVLGPAPGEGASGGVFLRELALAAFPPAAAVGKGLWNRFTLAGSPAASDAFVAGQGKWSTILALGRFVGGRFVTALDVSEVGGDWKGGREPPRPTPGGPGLPRLLFNVGSRPGAQRDGIAGLGETPKPLIAEVPARDGSEWVVFLPGGAGTRGDDSGEWLFALDLSGGVRSRFRIPAVAGAAISKNGAVTPAAAWRPGWGMQGAGDLITRIYVGDLHGQIHRLDLSDPDAWEWKVAHDLGGRQPIVTPPVVFPFPGRSEPHLLVVTGGDRRATEGPAEIVLLRDLGSRFEEVWRESLAEGEHPQGEAVVLTDGIRAGAVLPTRTVEERLLSCGAVTTRDGVSRLRAFAGATGAPLPGLVDTVSSRVSYGRGRIHGVNLSSRGNMALGVSKVGGEAFDAVIGDFKFEVKESALEEVTLFVEGFRRSPFS